MPSPTEDWFAKRELPRLELNIAVWVYTVAMPKTGDARAQWRDSVLADAYRDEDLRRVYALDISGGGMCVCFDVQQLEYLRSIFEQKALVGLTFFVPDPENPVQIHAVSEIRWSEEFNEEKQHGMRVGVRFIKLKPSDRDVIINWIIKRHIEKGLHEH